MWCHHHTVLSQYGYIIAMISTSALGQSRLRKAYDTMMKYFEANDAGADSHLGAATHPLERPCLGHHCSK